VPKQRLRDDLERLQQELERSPGVDPQARELVSEIARDVEALLNSAEGGAGETESLVDRLRSAAADFEESHPALTAVVGRIADTLAALGI
jgi:predicted component of type VI protein secretion system